jgi:adenine/guanine phosphoribosyltransferase-like PRPP-binding protein
MDAIARAGKEMARLVPPQAVLIPIPGRTGVATTARLLADEIARHVDACVADVLEGPARESVYEIKRRGGLPSPAALAFRRVAEVPPGTPVLVDDVFASGTTASAALALVPGAIVLVHAIAVRRRIVAAESQRAAHPPS